MPPDPESRDEAVARFLASVADIAWLSRAGDQDHTAIVAADLVDAWDNWNSEMLAVWRPQTRALETTAVQELGEDAVNAVFGAVSRKLDDPVSIAMELYFDTRSTDETNTDRGLWPEWIDSIKRDLSWAAIESLLDRPGFFTNLLQYYRAGRWPCAWEDGDISKRVVLL